MHFHELNFNVIIVLLVIFTPEVLNFKSSVFSQTKKMDKEKIKKAILKHFVIFTGKHLCWGLFFNKVAGHQACNFIKKRLQHRHFLANIRKFIRRPILKNICERLHFWKVFCENVFQIRTLQKEL